MAQVPWLASSMDGSAISAPNSTATETADSRSSTSRYGRTTAPPLRAGARTPRNPPSSSVAELHTVQLRGDRSDGVDLISDNLQKLDLLGSLQFVVNGVSVGSKKGTPFIVNTRLVNVSLLSSVPVSPIAPVHRFVRLFLFAFQGNTNFAIYWFFVK